MAVAVGMNGIVLADNARQAAAYDRVLKDVVNFAQARQEVVAGIAFFFHHFAELRVELFVELLRQGSPQDYIAARDELTHLFVCQEMVGNAHIRVLASGNADQKKRPAS